VDNATQRKVSAQSAGKQSDRGIKGSSRKGILRENSLRYDPTKLVREGSDFV
jgi:hypothetical protein